MAEETSHKDNSTNEQLSDSISNQDPNINTDKLKKKQKGVLDELEYIENENEKFWKTPSSTRMVRGGTLMITFDIISSLFFTVYMMTLSRAPTEDSSLLAIIDTMGLMLRFFAYLGFTGAGAKFMSEYRTRDKDMARIYAQSAAKYNMWVTGFPLIIIALILFLTKPETDVEYVAYASLLVIIIFDRLTSNVTIYILGSQRYDLYAYAYFFPYMLMYIASFITYNLFGVYGPLICFAVARIVMFISMSLMMRKACDFPYKDLWDWRKDYGLFWKMFKFNFLYSLANLAFSLLTTTLLISMGEGLDVLTPQEITALYTISTFSNILMNLFGVVGPIMVSVSEASAVKNKKLVENYVMIAIKFPILMSIAVLTFFILLGPEMIEIFYSARWITMGMLIMACLMPSYAFGSFAAKYDNILAGIGRPETVIFPWFVGLLIAVIGLATAPLLPIQYIVDDIITYKGETLNYGISIRFIWCMVTTSLGLIISGVWVIKICLKVLGVKIPLHFIWKPILAAGLTALILSPFKFVIPLRNYMDDWFGENIGGIVFTVVMVLVGVILYITFGLLMDMMNKEDGMFWKSIIGIKGYYAYNFKPSPQRFDKKIGVGLINGGKLIVVLILNLVVFGFNILFRYCKFLLRHQISYFKNEPIEWVLSTDKDTIRSNRQFKAKVIPLTRTCNVTEKGVEVHPGQELEFKLEISDMKVDLHNIIAYAKIDMTRLPNTLLGQDIIKKEVGAEFIVKVDVPADLLVGSHDLIIVLEAHETPREDITTEMYFKKGLWAYFDYRMRWLHEKEYYIYYEESPEQC